MVDKSWMNDIGRREGAGPERDDYTHPDDEAAMHAQLAAIQAAKRAKKMRPFKILGLMVVLGALGGGGYLAHANNYWGLFEPRPVAQPVALASDPAPQPQPEPAVAADQPVVAAPQPAPDPQPVAMPSTELQFSDLEVRRMEQARKILESDLREKRSAVAAGEARVTELEAARWVMASAQDVLRGSMNRGTLTNDRRWNAVPGALRTVVDNYLNEEGKGNADFQFRRAADELVTAMRSAKFDLGHDRDVLENIERRWAELQAKLEAAAAERQ